MPDYPIPVFHFQVEWGGTRLGFSEVSGLTIEVEAIEYREGSSPDYSTVKMPGVKTYGNITLKRGIIPNDNGFYEWLNTIRLNQVERRDLVISLLDENHQPVMVWKAVNAFPVKIEGPVLKATGNEVVPDASASYFSRCRPAMVTAAVRYRNDRGKGYRQMIRHNLGIYREIGVLRRPS